MYYEFITNYCIINFENKKTALAFAENVTDTWEINCVNGCIKTPVAHHYNFAQGVNQMCEQCPYYILEECHLQCIDNE